MEMVFCFCRACLDEIDRLYREGETLPEYLNAYTDRLCANCGRKLEIVGTRKFEVELINVQEQDGVHQYTEFEVMRFIPEEQAEAEPNYLLIISCSQRKITTPELLVAINRYDGVTYRILRKMRREGWTPENLDVLILSAKYGLMAAGMPADNYDQKMTDARADELRDSVQTTLKEFIDAKAGGFDQVFINLGKTYMRTLEGFHWGPVSTMEASGAIGLKNSQMKAWLERIAESSLSKGGVRE